MKQIVEQLYASLGAHEKKVFWLGVIAFAVGIIMLIDVLKPPSWFGWEETRADIVEARPTPGGMFNAGSTVFKIKFNIANGETLEALYKASPIVLGTMSEIKVFYKRDKPTHYYVYNPNTLIIGLTTLIFGFGIILSFYLYYKDKSEYNYGL
jgi:hypothetical protein